MRGRRRRNRAVKNGGEEATVCSKPSQRKCKNRLGGGSGPISLRGVPVELSERTKKERLASEHDGEKYRVARIEKPPPGGIEGDYGSCEGRRGNYREK